MSEPYPDPTHMGVPYTPSIVDIPGPMFKRVFFAMLAVFIIISAVVVAFQIFS